VFLPGSLASLGVLDQAMRDSLAESLIHIYEVAGQRFAAPDVDFDRGLSEIKAHRISPGVFGRYYDLVFAVHEERYECASVLLREMLQLASVRPIMTALPFSQEALGPDAERYARLLGLEMNSRVAFAAPAFDAWIAFQANLAAALACLEEAAPALAAELRSLIVQYVGAVPDSKTPGRGFGGASSFMLWGAILLNVQQHSTVLDMTSGLVHEAAHQLLFGLSVNEPLVENPIHERYASPLRTDLRPMDGIFHASFVCARMHYGYSRLRRCASKMFNEIEQALIQRRLDEYRKQFFQGLSTLERFGRMTVNGNRILNAAANYMRSVN
jgi:hypothetical protein